LPNQKKLIPVNAESTGNKPAYSTPFNLVEPYLIKRDGPINKDFEVKPFHSIPENVHIEITYACMEDCIMCYNPTRSKVSERDKAQVWSVVKRVAEAKVPHTYLIGGEPTYGYKKEELEAMVEYLTDHGSSVTIVTNGQITLKGMTNRLACYGVSIHGSNAEMHDYITRTPGSFDKAIRSIKSYIDEGHDVRIIPVVMGVNHSHMYGIAELAYELGAESLYYDVYEPGGIGEKNSHIDELNMAPSYSQLMIAIDQIIDAHDNLPFKGNIGFGTALPYCLHPGLAERRMLANCGVGTYFGAVTPQGHFRFCNQSKMNLGNVLQTDLSDIWLSNKFNEIYRKLAWVQEPCASCDLLQECGGGCRVDEGCASGELCIDRIVRGLPKELQHKISLEQVEHGIKALEYPNEYRSLKVTPWLDVCDKYSKPSELWPDGDRWVKTRYQTSSINQAEFAVITTMIRADSFSELDLIKTYEGVVAEQGIRQLVSQLISIEGLYVTQEHC